MNTRDYKQFGAGEHYHVFNRGNGKMDIFRDEEDYALFLQRLTEAVHPNRAAHVATMGTIAAPRRKPLPAGAFSLIVYCLMPNHFHLLIRQNTELPVSALLLKVCGSYSKIFNKKYDRVGSLFQDQFKAVHVADNTQLLHLSVYMHVNPRLAQLVRDAAKWKYSSYPEYLGLVEGGICDTNTVLGQFKNTRAYEKLVDDSFEDIRARKSAARDLMMDETV